MQFKDVIGQEQIVRMMVRGVDSGRVSHAQLLTGAGGYGGLPIAVAYTQYLNCQNRANKDSCGVCSSCVKIGQLAHPDLHFIFPVNSPRGSSGSQKPTSSYFLPQWRELFASSGGYFDEQMWYEAINIDNQQGLITRAEAEEIIKRLSFKSFEAQYKVVIIWLPERMRTEASNALLKILEEPWDKTVFLLVSEEPTKLLPTILSRTQEVAIPRLETSVIDSFLASKQNLEPSRRSIIARISGGDVIQAQRLAHSDMGAGNDEHFTKFMELMRSSYNDRHMELLEWAEVAAAMGRESQKRFFANSVRLLRESYMINAGMDNISYLWGAELDFCKKFSSFIGNHNIEKLVAEMELASAQIGQNGNPKIIFSHFALVVSKLIIKR